MTDAVKYTAEQTAENKSSWTPEEQAANRKKWTTALRSEEYPQGTGALRTVSGNYCCLGVACEVAAKEGVVTWSKDTIGAGYKPADGPGRENSVLPAEVMAWLGLGDVAGALVETVPNPNQVDEVYAFAALTELNDSAKYTFAQLADLIDADGVKLAVEEKGD